MHNENVSGVCRCDLRLGRIALLAAMAAAGSVHAQTSEGDLTEIYGPIGTVESVTAMQSGEETAQIAADCYSTFAGPTQFTWAGTLNQITGTRPHPLRQLPLSPVAPSRRAAMRVSCT